MPVKPIPDGYQTLIPTFAISRCAEAIEFYKKAFGAEERLRLTSPDGTIAHAEVEIGDSVMFFGEAGPQAPARNVQIAMYVIDCDAAIARAVAAGATVKQPATLQFYGDRSGRLADPFGNEWMISSRQEELSAEELERRWQKLLSSGQ